MPGTSFLQHPPLLLDNDPMPMSSPDHILNLRLTLTGHISSFFNWSLPPKCLQASQNQHVKIVTSFIHFPTHTQTRGHTHTCTQQRVGEQSRIKRVSPAVSSVLLSSNPNQGLILASPRITPVCMPPKIGSRTLTLLPSFLSLTWPGCHFCPSSLHLSAPSPPFSPLLASCAPSGLYPYLKPHCLKLLSSLLPFKTDPSQFLWLPFTIWLVSQASDHLSALHLCLYSPSVCPCWLFFQPESVNLLLLPGFPPLVSPLGTHTATALTFLNAHSHCPSAQNLQRFRYFPRTHLPSVRSSPQPSPAPLHPLPSVGIPALLSVLPPCDVFRAPRGDALLFSPSLFPDTLLLLLILIPLWIHSTQSLLCSCFFCLIIEMTKWEPLVRRPWLLWCVSAPMWAWLSSASVFVSPCASRAQW